MKFKVIFSFILVILSLISLTKSETDPIIYVNDYGVSTITYDGDKSHLYIIADISEYDLSNDLTVQFNTEVSIQTDEICYSIPSSNPFKMTYEQLESLSFYSPDIFYEVDKERISKNNTYTYTMEKEMISSFDSYIVFRVPLLMKSTKPFSAWIDHGLSSGEIVAIVLISIFAPIIITVIIIIACCYCVCCSWYRNRYNIANNVSNQPLIPMTVQSPAYTSTVPAVVAPVTPAVVYTNPPVQTAPVYYPNPAVPPQPMYQAPVQAPLQPQVYPQA